MERNPTDLQLPEHSSGDRLRLALGLWIAVACAVAIKSFLNPDRHSIFPILSAAVEHWWHDRPLYDDYKPLDFFRYPPTFAIALSPFVLLGPALGSIVWTLLGMAVYLLGLWRFGIRVLTTSESKHTLAFFLILGCVGGLRGFWNAQANALVTGLILLGVDAWIGRRWWPAAWFFAGSVIIKLTPLAVVLLFVALRPRVLGGRVAFALLVFALVPFLTKPPGIVVGHYGELYSHLLRSSGERWPGFRDVWTIHQVIARQAAGLPGVPELKCTMESPGTYRCIQILSAASVLLWCLWQQRLRISESELAIRTLGMGMAWLMLLGPSTEHPTYVFLAPSLALALHHKQLGWRRVVLWLSACLILVLGWSSLTEPIQNLYPWTLTALPVGTLLYVVWLIAYATPSAQQNSFAAPGGLTLTVTEDQGVSSKLAA